MLFCFIFSLLGNVDNVAATSSWSSIPIDMAHVCCSLKDMLYKKRMERQLAAARGQLQVEKPPEEVCHEHSAPSLQKALGTPRAPKGHLRFHMSPFQASHETRSMVPTMNIQWALVDSGPSSGGLLLYDDCKAELNSVLRSCLVQKLQNLPLRLHCFLSCCHG